MGFIVRYIGVFVALLCCGVCAGQVGPSDLDGELLGVSVYDGIAPIQSLLERGAHIDARDMHGDTLLLLAADHGKLEVVTYLIQKGASVNVKNRTDDTPLALAARNNTLDVVNALLNHGADVNAGLGSDTTPLFEALIAEDRQDKGSMLRKIRTLIDHGADIQAGEQRGMSPVRYASQADSDNDILKLLLEQGARPNARDEHGDTALTWAQVGASRLLLDHGADIETRNNEGTTPLMEAAEFGDTAKIRLLLARGAKLNVKDNKGRKALDYARTSHEVHGAKKSQTIHLLTSLGKRV